MLNGHDASIRKDLLWEIVDELPVHKAVDAMADDVLDLFPHLIPLCFLDVRHLQASRSA